jgi:hypothetical protein
MRKIFCLTIVLQLAFVIKGICQTQVLQRVVVKKGLQIVLSDTIFITKHDTVLFLTNVERTKLKIRLNPYSTSNKFYDSLAKKASSNRIVKDILDLVIKKKGRKEKLVSVIVKSEDVFKPFAGLVIGSIAFKYVDLLEGSVIDTLQTASSKFGKFVNKIHRDTRASVIKQNLLFKVGDKVDPFTLADNERVLRQFITLRDARIYISKNKRNPTIVDIVVVTQDVTSLGVSGSYNSLRKFRLDVYDINILGYAKQLQVSYFRNADDLPEHGYEITLREPNLLGAFVQSEFQYTNNFQRQRVRLAFARDFFTPEIKYAGGAELYHTREQFYFEAYDTLQIPYTEKAIDLWTGRSFEFKKRINFIFSARVSMRNFIDRPLVSKDSNSFFYNRTLVLGSLVLTKRNFLKSLRIRGFGRTEDIPIGRSVNIVFGKEITEFVDRPYFEFGTTYGKYFTAIGYINIATKAGTFFKYEKVEDGLVSISSTYFSNLLKVRRMQIRQFSYLTYTRGFKRILDKTLSLDGKWRDKNDFTPLGNRRITIGFETVYFMPWYAYGFQFALFHRFDLNLLSDNKYLLAKKSLFSTLQVGIRMLNENLVLPAFSIDGAYFGKNKNFVAAWELKFATTLPDLFGTRQIFKPQVSNFN